MIELKQTIEQLKTHLEENDGEVVYWGNKIECGMGNAECGVKEEISKYELLKDLREREIGDCHLCPLGDTRIKLVFGVGNPEAEVMFIGEGPGFDEDRQGEPFVGEAGRLLDRIMAAIGLDRKKVYIANAVKCHPMIDPTKANKRGNNRAPSPEEIETCLPFLKKQIAIIKPRFIVLLGGVATKAVLGTVKGITSLRGKFIDLQLDHEIPAIPVLPTFHPAALLRDESLKKLVWEDMKLLRERLRNAEFQTSQ